MTDINVENRNTDNIWLSGIMGVVIGEVLVLYECYWIRYFRSKKTLSDLYSSFAGYPVAGASLPVIAVLLLGKIAFKDCLIISGLYCVLSR